MPSEDWYKDRFATTTKQDTLDLSDVQTTELSEFSDRYALQYETDFIDELYGTDNAHWDKEYSPRLQDVDDIEITWGLDLKRVFKDDLKVGNWSHYEHITKGEVDWAHYENSSKYQEAFKQLKEDKDSTKSYYGLDWNNFTDSDADDRWSERQRIDFIRDANAAIKEGPKKEEESEDAWKTEWEGKYDPNHITRTADGTLFIDGEAQQTIKDQIASGEINADVSSFSYTRKDPDGNDVTVTADAEGNLSDNAFDPIAGPPTAVVKPNIPTPSAKVKIPANVPKGWHGDVKSTIKISDYAGGKK